MCVAIAILAVLGGIVVCLINYPGKKKTPPICKKEDRALHKIEVRNFNVKKATFKLTFDNGETFNITRYGYVSQIELTKPKVLTVDSMILSIIENHFYEANRYSKPIINDSYTPTKAVHGVLKKMELVKISDHEVSFDEKVWL